MDHAIPEELRGGAIPLVAVEFIAACQANQLGNLSVRMFARQDVLPIGQRFQNGPVMEPARESEVPRILCIGVQVRKRLVDAAMFRGEYLLHLFVGQVLKRQLIPIGQLAFDRQGVGVAAQAIRITQPGQQFMQRVVGNPTPIQVEPGGANVASCDLRKNSLAVRNGGQVPGSQRCLASFQFRNHVVHAFQKSDVAGCGIRDRTGAQVMARAVSRNALRFPTAVVLGFRCETGFFAEVGQQPIGFKLQQVIDCDILALLEGTIE